MEGTLETGRRPIVLIERDAATTWTEERLAELRRLWVEETLSSSEIAWRMGISRGTVMGKINRLGLLRHRGAPFPPMLQEPAPAPATPSAADCGVMETHASSCIGSHPSISELRAGRFTPSLSGPLGEDLG